MSLFGKLRGEFIDIIEWLDPSNDTLAYRFERFQNEIKNGAKLTVRPGQTAVFVNEGQIADVFGPGMYSLTTQNLPILSTLQGWPYGFNSPFKAEVYFFNTKQFTNLKWGTSNPIMLRDADFGVVRVRAYGNYSIRIVDPAALLQELVSTDGLFQVDRVQDHLRNIIVTAFASWLGRSQIPIIDLAAHYRELGEQVRSGIQGEMQNLGIELSGLLIENVSVPETVEQALDKRASMGVLGNMQQYAQYQAANAVEQSAQNPGGGNSALDFGVGMAMGQQLANSFGQQTPHTPQTPPPPPTAQWYMAKNNQQLGPFNLNQLSQQGLTADTLVWRAGLAEWQPAVQVPELASILPPPVAPPIPQPQVARGEWYIFRNGESLGPFNINQLPEQGLSSRTNVRREGETEWVRARDVAELAPLLASLGE
ncbi:SPFH domain-containing protein [Kamptonema cortianum]|uniref:SPFH domain-containing protein n=1 Tax=Geitlerinema calcuttense NRMC-F 0142 TaxID=2922238 RepID=A0ABT7LW84_9CYAN|nr:SPFH domain-containing protein [Geitlerinema calcuttense]MDK3159189.1 SPFH domain-containing protein [Kamptonema cortianum]MDL5056291.1 SPFH domain-containing protein [Geitlerinema calcuttense NRMC-F 0142]